MTGNTQNAKGSCLCGAVTIHAATMSNKIGACHCGFCRKWSGGPLMSVDCGTRVTFEGEAYISRYNSSDWAERAFCKQCGSNLFYRLKQNNQYILPIGLFDNIEPVVFDHQIYIDKKPKYYEFANQTHNMTEAEVIQMYMSQSAQETHKE